MRNNLLHARSVSSQKTQNQLDSYNRKLSLEHSLALFEKPEGVSIAN